jgi:hypothetical protein
VTKIMRDFRHQMNKTFFLLAYHLATLLSYASLPHLLSYLVVPHLSSRLYTEKFFYLYGHCKFVIE